jgi:hypothetical protein
MTPDQIVMVVGVGIDALIKLGLSISESQRHEAERAAIAAMKIPAPDLGSRYLAEIAKREKSDMDEVSRRAAVYWAHPDACPECGAKHDTDPLPEPPPTLPGGSELSVYDEPEGEG